MIFAYPFKLGGSVAVFKDGLFANRTVKGGENIIARIHCAVIVLKPDVVVIFGSGGNGIYAG